MTSAIIHHSIYSKHDTGLGHPETPRRYNVVMDALREDGDLWGRLIEITPEKASKGEAANKGNTKAIQNHMTEVIAWAYLLGQRYGVGLEKAMWSWVADMEQKARLKNGARH